MNYALQILQFTVGGDFWRFLGCWLIIGTVVAGISNVLATIVAAFGVARARLGG